jgi:hypothetical protein
MYKKLCVWMRWLTSRYPDNSRMTALRDELAMREVQSHPVAESVIAVQCLEDPFYFGLFAAICQQLREFSGVAGELVVIRSISGAVGNGWGQRLARSSPVGSIVAAQWIRAFRGIVDRVAYRSLSFTHLPGDFLDWFRSRALWRRQCSNAEFQALRIHGVPVGDLIIDSYLRFRPSPRFDVTDPFVRRLIWQAHRDVRRAQGYFRSRRPQAYLTAYATYIEHGIAVRVALQAQVRVHSFGSFSQFGKTLSLSDWFHTTDTSGYRSIFKSLDRQQERLAQAEQGLRDRLSGQIDIATSYMNRSAYARGSDPMPDVAGATVVFLHDFYDSPHIFDNLVFHDFWAWTCFTIDVLKQGGRKFFLKPHPNQISLSAEVLDELLTRYPGLPLLSQHITNVQLADAAIVCGVTVYGTVSHELAYLGVPSIACARHPHHGYDFCRTATSAEEYRSYLSTPEQRPISLPEMRRQALEFYYMNNLYGDADTLALRHSYAAFWKACHSADADVSAMVQRFRELRDSPAFKRRVQCLC